MFGKPKMEVLPVPYKLKGENMNTLKRQMILCPDCKGTGEHVMGEEGRLYSCGLCFGRKTIPEPDSVYIARLVALLEKKNKVIRYLATKIKEFR